MTISVCIYCGARVGNNPAFADAAQDLGIALAKSGWNMVYGGGSVGLMGVAARASMSAGGHVIGIIPTKLIEYEQGMKEVSELVVTDTMRERKSLMFDRSDVFVTLPGGFGTIEEVVETLTLRQLRYHNKPIYLLNIAGYYDPFIAFFEHGVSAGFIHPDQLKLYKLIDSVDELITQIEHDTRS